VSTAIRRATFDIRPSSTGVHSLSIAGILPSGWIGSLAGGMAARRFDIRSGFGSRDSRGMWNAQVEFAAPVGTAQLDGLDFEQLATGGVEARGETPLTLRSWHLVGPEEDASLGLSVVAQDSVGFLANLLRHLTLFSLFPHEFVIDTEGAVVRDRFALRGVAGRRPSPEVCQALGLRLEGLTPSSDRTKALPAHRRREPPLSEDGATL
jgi:hypothetical protein